jgi:hypothetical protein
LCKTFLHQFSLIAKRPPPPPAKKRQGGPGDGDGRQPFRHRKRAPGLAAVKHAQQEAARALSIAEDSPTPPDERRTRQTPPQQFSAS